MGDLAAPPDRLPAHLVLFSGPPGAGKSSLSYALSRRTGWVVLSKDSLDRTCERLAIPNWPPIAAYQMMLDLADLNLRHGASLILDAVFPKGGFRLQAAEIAARHGARFRAVVCYCSDPAIWRHRVAERPEMVPGWTPANWNESRRVASVYESWTGPRLAVDAINSLEHNLGTVLRYVLTEPP